jgi:hypothetical protein
MPADLTEWHKVEMNNWTQYCSEINGVKVHIRGQILELSMPILEANTHTPGLPFNAINQN